MTWQDTLHSMTKHDKLSGAASNNSMMGGEEWVGKPGDRSWANEGCGWGGKMKISEQQARGRTEWLCAFALSGQRTASRKRGMIYCAFNLLDASPTSPPWCHKFRQSTYIYIRFWHKVRLQSKVISKNTRIQAAHSHGDSQTQMPGVALWFHKSCSKHVSFHLLLSKLLFLKNK